MSDEEFDDESDANEPEKEGEDGEEEKESAEQEEERLISNPLTEEIMKEGLSLLCKTGNGLAHAYVKLEAKEKDLTDIGLLQNYIHLRYVDLSENQLRDLSPLGSLIHLLWLKVDGNRLTSATLQELPYLQIASFAHNHIKDTEGISHPRLGSLNLKGNEIQVISGLDPGKLANLHTLELRGNKIETTAGLHLPKLKNLYLAQNSISRLEGLQDLVQLTTLHLRDNQLVTLDGFSSNMKCLQYLNLRGNGITGLQEVAKLQVLPMLRALVLLDNPCADEGDYRLEILVLLSHLERLDKDFYEQEERMEAEELRQHRQEEEQEQEQEQEQPDSAPRRSRAAAASGPAHPGVSRRLTLPPARAAPAPLRSAPRREKTGFIMSIEKIHAREILDSRGNPTVEVDLCTQKGMFRAAVPSGASTGIYEALELRDDDKSRFLGKGVLQAVDHINNTIAPALLSSGLSVVDQEKIDNLMIEMDGTENKSKFGANAILGVSLAVCKAGAAEKEVPLYRHIADLAGNSDLILPVPAFNVINGGSHAGNKLAMQEFMILPVGAESFRDAMQIGAEVYHNLKSVIKEKYGKDATNVGDEGGFAPNILENSEALELLKEAIDKAGYTDKIVIGMDVAASEFYRDGKYDLDFKSPDDPSRYISADELGDLYQSFVHDYPVVSIEDPFDQDDWEAWTKFTANVAIQIVGDDLTVTNPKRIERAVEEKACNCLLLKVNQIGSVTEAIQACKLAQENGWGVMVSHRSGETEDTFIADLVVGLCTGQIKTGAPCRSERLAKYNQLMRIEEELGDEARFAGHNFRNPIGSDYGRISELPEGFGCRTVNNAWSHIMNDEDKNKYWLSIQ
ncbi:hypothetical protein Y1Q_0002916 [Alligator mississippiensis]|uniref:Leucine-rich repeat-containing protein 23 n=3 Tax=Archosauria TaxID=8492 RepID=A0A151MCQ7_ALLMI|nr:hypothetical protein Y1Q_0002916 [Alligator mississippiensis]